MNCRTFSLKSSHARKKSPPPPIVQSENKNKQKTNKQTNKTNKNQQQQPPKSDEKAMSCAKFKYLTVKENALLLAKFSGSYTNIR